MLKDNISIHQLTKKNDSVKIEQVNSNELIILLPFAGFTIKVDTPKFNIKGISPAEITLKAITSCKFLIQINTPEFNLITVVHSLVLEVFNPEGVRIIRIVAPPKIEQAFSKAKQNISHEAFKELCRMFVEVYYDSNKNLIKVESFSRFNFFVLSIYIFLKVPFIAPL